MEDFFIHDDPCYEFAIALNPMIFLTFKDLLPGVYEEKMILGNCGFIDPKILIFILPDGYLALARILSMILEVLKK